MPVHSLTSAEQLRIAEYKRQLLRVFGGPAAMITEPELKIGALLDAAVAIATYTDDDHPKEPMSLELLLANMRNFHAQRSQLKAKAARK